LWGWRDSGELGQDGAMAPLQSNEIRLKARPDGPATTELFAISQTEVPDPGPGEVRVRNLFMSVDPYMRGRLVDRPSYAPPFGLGKVLDGGALGVVESSGDPGVAVGSKVLSFHGWREVFTCPASEVRVLPDLPAGISLGAWLGALGMTGMTAWVGITDIAPVHDGETLFVSAASGAVGSVAGQLAKARGARVVGSAGGAAKVAFVLDTLGFDAAFSYRDRDLVASLRHAAPEGIDVYFDNVGGAQLDAALLSMRPGGRIALCGSIHGYDRPDGGDPVRALAVAIGKRLSLKGFIVSDHDGRRAAFLEELIPLVESGAISAQETIVEGLDQAPRALLDLLNSGPQLGKLLVRLAQA